MKGNLLLAMGLSAIDGLLCAFVAILSLAFVMPSEPAGAQRVAQQATQLILVEKSQGAGGLALLGLQLTLVEPSGRSVAGFALPANGSSDMEWNDAVPLKGTWADCRPTNGRCAARLVVRGMPAGASLAIRPYIVDSAGSLLDVPADSVSLEAMVIDSGSGRKRRSAPLKLTYNSGPADGEGWTLGLEPGGNVHWVSGP